MTGLVRCTRSGTCQAVSGCQQPSRFQAHLDPAQQPRLHKRAEACTSHLDAMVQAMTNWAREHDLTEGELLIIAIDPLPGADTPGPGRHRPCAQADGLIFGTISLGA